MDHEPSGGDPLRGAVAAMRDEIDGIIAEERARLLGGPPTGDVEARLDGARRRGPLGPPWEPPPFAPRPPGVAAADPPSDRGDATGHDGIPGDTERRLDALALRLEGRLRRARDRAADRPRPDDPAEGPGGPDSGRGTAPSGGI